MEEHSIRRLRSNAEQLTEIVEDAFDRGSDGQLEALILTTEELIKLRGDVRIPLSLFISLLKGVRMGNTAKAKADDRDARRQEVIDKMVSIMSGGIAEAKK